MGLPNLLAQIGRPAAGRLMPTPALEQIEQSESWLSQLATLPLEAGKALLNAIDWIDATTRAGIGQAMGVEGTGRETPFGQAPTGRELLEPFGLGPGEEGKFELGDVLGFGTEVLLSPFMLLGTGLASKAGTTALRAGKLTKQLQAASAAGRVPERWAAGRKLVEVARGAGVARGKPTKEFAQKGLERLTMGIGEQARAGYRPLLSFDIPGLVNQPLLKGVTAMRGIGALGRGMAWPFKKLGIPQALRPGGRMGIPLFDASIDLKQSIARGEELTGADLSKIVDLSAEQLAQKHPERILEYQAEVEKALRSTRETAIRRIDKRYEGQIERLEANVSWSQAKKDKRARAYKAKQLHDTATWTTGAREHPLDASLSAIRSAGSKWNVPDKIRKQFTREIERFHNWETRLRDDAIKADRRVAEEVGWEGSLSDILAGGEATTKALRLIGMRRGKVAAKLGMLRRKKRQAEVMIRLLPEEWRAVVSHQMHALGELETRVLASGAPLKPLPDPFLTWLPENPTPEMLDWARTLKDDHPFKMVAKRTHSTTSPHFRQRAKFWWGLTTPQRNDLAKQMGFPGKYAFYETAEDTVLKAFRSTGNAEAGSHFWAGTIQMFAVEPGAVPKGIATVPIEEAIASSKLARIGNVDVPFRPVGEKGTRIKGSHVLPAIRGTNLEGKVMPRDVFEALRDFDLKLREPGWIETFLRKADWVNGIFRVGVTQMFPGFHGRNKASDTFMCLLRGMRNPAWFSDMLQLQARREFSLAAQAGTKPPWWVVWVPGGSKPLAKAQSQLYEDAVRHGSVGQTFAKETMEQLERGGVGGGFYKAAAWAARKGQFLEDNSKLALFAFERSRGATPQEAGEVVRKYLFDYQDLSKGEKQYVRRLAYFYCVPTDCEILTRNGWKRHNELEIGEQVLGLDTETHKSRWTDVNDIAVFDYNGELLGLSTVSGDFPFTPNHRWPVIDHRGQKQVRRGYDLRSNLRIPRAAEFTDWPTKSLLTPREAAIVGWLITDGTLVTGHARSNWAIYQSPKKFAKEIEALLGEDASKRQTHPDTGVYQWPIRASLRHHLRAKGFRSRADAIWIATRLDKEAAAAMWDAMYKADGTTVPHRKQDNFACRNDDVFDVAQILVQLFGGYMNRGTKGGTPNWKTPYLKVAGAFAGVRHYAGQVWCPNTGTGTWLMRRNGKVIWSGNTFMRKNIPLMVEQLLLDPRKGRLYGYATGAVGSRRAGRYEALPPWMSDVEPFDFGRDEEGNRIFATLGLPPEDIFRWSSQGRGVFRVAQKVAATLAPTFRVPIEALTGTSLAMGKPKRPISPLVQKGVEALPEGLREGLEMFGIPQILHEAERMAPTSRFTGSLRQALQSAGAMEQPGWREPTGMGQAALAFGTGVRLTPLEQGEAGFRNEIRRIALSLNRLKSLGRDKSEQARQLRRLRSRLQKRLE